jgi:hypothetical protein
VKWKGAGRVSSLMDAVELVTTTRETPGLQDAHGTSDSGAYEHFWILGFEMEWAGHVHNASHSFHRFVKGVWLEVQLALHTWLSTRSIPSQCHRQ